MSVPTIAPADRVARYGADEVSDVIGRLSDSGLLASGSVVVASLDAVRQRFAERWPIKADQVWEHAERSFERDLGAPALVIRAGESDLLIAESSADIAGARARAMRVLRDVLTHFLGKVTPADIVMRIVTGVEGGALVCRDMSQAEIAEASAPPAIVGRAARDGSQRRDYRVLATEDGTPLRISTGYEQLMRIGNPVIAAHRLRPCVVDVSGPSRLSVRSGGLDWRDCERVDLASLSLGLDQLAEIPARPPVLITPVSFATLSAVRGRREYLALVEEAGRRLGCRVAIEVQNARNVPHSRLSEVVARVRPACFGVLVEAGVERSEIAALADCGFNGVSIRIAPTWTTDPRLIAHVSALAEACRRIAPICIVRTTDTRSFDVAEAANATHALIPPRNAVHAA